MHDDYQHGTWACLYHDDGTYQFVKFDRWTDYQGVKHHEAQVIEILDLDHVNPEMSTAEGPYYISHGAWDLPYLDLQTIAQVVQTSGGAVAETSAADILAAHAPDAQRWLAEQAQALRGQSSAPLFVKSVNRLKEMAPALAGWYAADDVTRAAWLFSYFGGDEATIAYHPTLKSAMDYEQIDTASMPASLVKEYETDSHTDCGWGRECGICGEAVYPRERHARMIARAFAEAWTQDDHKTADKLGGHLHRVIGNMMKIEHVDAPAWYAGEQSFDSSYLDLPTHN